jgi:hypothetical protein
MPLLVKLSAAAPRRKLRRLVMGFSLNLGLAPGTHQSPVLAVF